MKKFVVLSFISLLILAFGSIVYGQEKAPVLEFKASGFIDMQTFWQKNATQANPAAGIYQTFAYNNNTAKNPALDNGSVAFWESRARLKFDAIMGPNLSGTFFFEFDSAPWGNVSTGTRNSYGYWGGDRASLEIKNIYLTFGLPVIPVPMQFRVGEQGFALRPNILLTTDGAGITWDTKIDPIVIQLMYGKIFENAVQGADDNDMYGVHFRGNFGTFTPGVYWLYYHMNTYPSDPTNATGLAPGAAGLNNKAELSWFGGYLDGKVGPVTMNLDFIYDYGFVASRADVKPDPRSVRYQGWLAHGKVDYAIEKANIGLLAYYASGADAENTSISGLPGTAAGGGKGTRRVTSYIIPTSSESGAAYGESAVFYSFWLTRGDAGIGNNLNYTQSCRGGLGGTWMAKLYASYLIFPDFKMTLQGMYIGDTTKNGNTIGNARGENGRFKDYSYIGTEFDLIGEWQVYKNLAFRAAYGYMFAGSAMKTWNASTNSNHMIQNPYGFYTNLTYSF